MIEREIEREGGREGGKERVFVLCKAAELSKMNNMCWDLSIR